MGIVNFVVWVAEMIDGLLLGDPRKRRGVRHSIAAILAIAAAAVLAGSRSVLAVGE